jgi:hypothetical protein
MLVATMGLLMDSMEPPIGAAADGKAIKDKILIVR